MRKTGLLLVVFILGVFHQQLLEFGVLTGFRIMWIGRAIYEVLHP